VYKRQLTAKNIAMALQIALNPWALAEEPFPPGQIDLAGRDW
jgi:hypothetical protein